MPTLHDFFAIPDREMDERVFVVSDVMTYVERRQSGLAITFHGALEWALDYVMVTEVLWMLSETQVREELERYLVDQPRPALTLTSTLDGYRCEMQYKDQTLAFEAFGASDAYAQALLYILRQS